MELASRSPKQFCNTSVSSFQWALVSTLFSHTHVRAFLAVMVDVIKQIPALKAVSLRQDSAGCYHCRACRATIVCAGVLGAELGVVFKLLAPFPPHGGNWEPVTARPAGTKSDTFILLNSGHDIRIPVENHPQVSAGARSLQAL